MFPQVRILTPEYTSIVNSEIENTTNANTTTTHNIVNHTFYTSGQLSAYRHNEKERDDVPFYWPTRPNTFFARDINAENFRNMEETALVLRMADTSVTASYLQTHWTPPGNSAPETCFTSLHRDVLIYLVTGRALESAALLNVADLPPEKRLSMQAALAEIALLNSAQCLSLLRLYYPNGLKGDHLRSWQPLEERREYRYSPSHSAALSGLILLNNVPLLEAVQQINRKTPNEAAEIYAAIRERIATGGVQPEQVLSNFQNAFLRR